MRIERITALPDDALQGIDFSFDIKLIAVPPFDGARLTQFAPVKPYRKAYATESSPSDDGSIDRRLTAVTREDGKIAGYIVASRSWNGCVLIEDLAVARPFRRRGFGRLLLDEAVGWTKDQGLTILRLETQSNNVAACRFYERNSFVLGGFDRYLYRDLGWDVGSEVALFWYRFLDAP